MPTEPIELEKHRAGAILAWLAEKFPTLEGLAERVRDELDMLMQLPAGATYADVLFTKCSPVTGRYFVLNLIHYGREIDEHSYESAGTLEEAQTEVEEHVFSLNRSDYSYESRVFDTHLKRELPFERVEKIEWTLDGYEHLTLDQRAKIDQVAVEVIVENAQASDHYLEEVAKDLVETLDVEGRLDKISSDSGVVAGYLGFDPDTGEPIPEARDEEDDRGETTEE